MIKSAADSNEPANRSQEKPSMTESAADRARRLWDGNPATTARALLKELLAAPDQEEAVTILLPWITDRVRAAIRTDVRHAEQDTFTSPAGRPRVATEIRTQQGRMPALDNMELLLSLPVLVPAPGNKTQSVSWGEMTIEDHEARIGSLQGKRQALLGTIERHEWAVGQISKYKVRCLNDIDVAVLRTSMPRLA